MPTDNVEADEGVWSEEGFHRQSTREPTDAQLAAWEETHADLVDQGVEYCLAAFVDIHGRMKSKAVPISDKSRFVDMMKGSELYTGAANDGLGGIVGEQEPIDDEISAWPDNDAITVLPWKDNVAWAPSHLHLHGNPYRLGSRNVLQKQVKRALEMGFEMNLGIEVEYFLVRETEDGEIVGANPEDDIERACYDVDALLDQFDYQEQMREYLDEMGWEVVSLVHEDADNQFEFDLHYDDCMTTSDRLVLLRMMARRVAKQAGFDVTFMPKPFGERTGTGGHFNMSLANVETGENVFQDESDERGLGLSETAYQFIAGIMEHLPAITAVAAPTVNSYKRLVASGSMTGYTWAPVYISYGDNNRSHAVRVPTKSPRMEVRSVDLTVNPYLASAMFLGAGLEGIEKGLDPGEPIADNMWELDEDELDDRGIETLPRTLLEAVEAFEDDSITDRILGEKLSEEYAEFKKQEWWDWHHTISDWEHERYVKIW
ncbi:type III glutamate--ammonia ligase [Halobacteriales archaeon QS_9_67_15]|nr:MAG: type III glutamate--ammonia ligase [Halobacteriales archaeon QS_9_67_15]